MHVHNDTRRHSPVESDARHAYTLEIMVIATLTVYLEISNKMIFAGSVIDANRTERNKPEESRLEKRGTDRCIRPALRQTH